TAGGPASLILQAANDITVNQSITSTSGALDLLLQAGGNVTLNAGIDTHLGTFTSSGVAYTQAVGSSVVTAGGNVLIDHTGAVALNTTIDADSSSGSSVEIHGASATIGATVTSGSGGIALRPANTASTVGIDAVTGGFDLTGASLGNLAAPA